MTPNPKHTTPKQRVPLPRKCTDAEIDKNRTAFPHALPFQLFFEEISARRKDDLAAQIRALFGVPKGDEERWLETELGKSADAYKLLIKSKGMNTHNKVMYSNVD